MTFGGSIWREWRSPNRRRSQPLIERWAWPPGRRLTAIHARARPCVFACFAAFGGCTGQMRGVHAPVLLCVVRGPPPAWRTQFLLLARPGAGRHSPQRHVCAGVLHTRPRLKGALGARMWRTRVAALLYSARVRPAGVATACLAASVVWRWGRWRWGAGPALAHPQLPPRTARRPTGTTTADGSHDEGREEPPRPPGDRGAHVKSSTCSDV